MTSKDLFKFFFDYSLPVREIVETKFLPLTFEQLNRKPSPESWSAGECFEHLLHTNGLYFPIFQDVLGKMKNQHINSGIDFKYTFVGKMVIKSVDPEQIKKYKSPKAFRTTVNRVREDILKQFLQQHELLLTQVKKFEGTDLRKIKIVSPASSLVKYNLGDCLMIIAYHNKRHIAQAERTLNSVSNQMDLLK